MAFGSTRSGKRAPILLLTYLAGLLLLVSFCPLRLVIDANDFSVCSYTRRTPLHAQ
jgi:hypothetical protein